MTVTLEAPLARADLIHRICAEVGAAATLIDPATGWPGFIDVDIGTGARRLAVHVGPVGRLYPDRREDDYRVQPPAANRPIMDHPGAISMALGFWNPPPSVIVACPVEPWREAGMRTSQMFKLAMLQEAQQSGWGTYQNSDDEIFHAFRPFLLPAYVEAVVNEVEIPGIEVTQALEHADIAGDDTPRAQERARRAVTAVVRDSRFRDIVLSAYNQRCAMCGLGSGVVVGAHIHPVAEPGSVDEVWNGLCLCANHHQAFDAHFIWVHPETRQIQLHSILREATDAPDRQFAASTYAELHEPTDPRYRPRAEMFQRRYSRYEEGYTWVGGSTGGESVG